MTHLVETINRHLENYLAPKYPELLYESMGYSLLAGGKRVRPQMLVLASISAGGETAAALPFACALEMIHAYSLIHDDLPAMDDDDFRRGKPTNHKMYGEAMAILAGDGLLSYAFEIMSAHCLSNPRQSNLAAMAEIARVAGVGGMVAGQVVDIAASGKAPDSKTLLYMYEKKTCALFEGAVCAGVYLGMGENNDCETVVENARKAARLFGLAFQIKDDLLDIQSTSEVLGKPVMSDEKNDKFTYVKLYGVEKAEQDYYEYSGQAAAILKDMGFENNALVDYMESLLNRRY